MAPVIRIPTTPAQIATSLQAFNPRNMVLGMVAMYSVPLLLVLACAATSFVSLLLPSTGAWFLMAGQARREHQALLAALGD